MIKLVLIILVSISLNVFGTDYNTDRSLSGTTTNNYNIKVAGDKAQDFALK